MVMSDVFAKFIKGFNFRFRFDDVITLDQEYYTNGSITNCIVAFGLLYSFQMYILSNEIFIVISNRITFSLFSGNFDYR